MSVIQTTKKLRKRQSYDYYPSPLPLCVAALQRFRDRTEMAPRVILDPGAGAGPWGDAYRRVFGGGWLIGTDLRAVPPNPSYDAWHTEQDYLAVWADQILPANIAGADLIIGNPPYGDGMAEKFVRRSLQLLNPGGYLIFLLRIEFLCSQRRGTGLWQELPPRWIDASSRRPSFTGNGKTDATDYALFTWQQGWRGATIFDWLDWGNDNNDRKRLAIHRAPAVDQGASSIDSGNHQECFWL